MRYIRGGRWWRFRCELGTFEASGLMAAVGLAVGIGCAMAVEAPFLIPICAAACGLAPFCVLSEERAKWDMAFDRRFRGTLRLFLGAFLIAALWISRHQIAAFPKVVCLVVAFILSCVILASYTVWGLILAFRGVSKPKPAGPAEAATNPNLWDPELDPWA